MPKLYEKILDVVVKDTSVEITKTIPSNTMLLSYPPQPAPDRVYKEIYEIVDGQLVKTTQIEGSLTPSRVIPSKITFEDN